MSVLGVCGAQGALLYKFKKNLIANIEPRGVFHTKNEEQWKLNFGEIPFLKSPDSLIMQKIHPDIIIGSPSCGHSSVFSYSRKKTLGKPREDATLTLYLNAVLTFKPKIFLLENLPKLMDLIPLEEWQEKLPDYELIVHCHSVMAFGNSQKSRKRLILIGIRKKSGIDSRFFNKIFRVAEPMTVRQIMKKVRKPLNFREDPDKKLAMYHYKDKTKTTLTVEQVRQLWRGEFKNEYKWPMKTHKMKTLPGVYRNRLETYPLTVRPSSRQFNPKGKVMGLEEYRIIMGFPETFKVYFDKENKTYWLNKGRNALTKGSVFEVGIWFHKCIQNSIKG